MILTGNEIARQVENGRISIENFDPTRLTTNSYDLTLGEELLEYEGDVLDPRQENPVRRWTIPRDGHQLQAGDFVLGTSGESFGSDFYVPQIHAKSGIARLGLFVHMTANLIDIGAYGRATYQLHSTLPVTLYASMLIAQVTFWLPQGKIELYSGKYQGTRSPLPSLSWKSGAL